jgi:hypothetical protein
MKRPDLRNVSYKRVLICYEALGKYHIGDRKCNEFFDYFFNISEVQITRILRTHSLSDFSEVELPHIDIDLRMVDTYCCKILDNASKQQNKQIRELNHKKR